MCPSIWMRRPLSPPTWPWGSDTFGSVAVKVQQYLDSGTQIVWVVRPEIRTVEVYHPNSAPSMISSGDLTGAPVLPDFRVAVEDIFAV